MLYTFFSAFLPCFSCKVHVQHQYSVRPLLKPYRIVLILQKGTKAPQAAGRIHTDFEKGFVMAEVMKFDDFKQEGSEADCKVSDLSTKAARGRGRERERGCKRAKEGGKWTGIRGIPMIEYMYAYTMHIP